MAGRPCPSADAPSQTEAVKPHYDNTRRVTDRHLEQIKEDVLIVCNGRLAGLMKTCEKLNQALDEARIAFHDKIVNHSDEPYVFEEMTVPPSAAGFACPRPHVDRARFLSPAYSALSV